MNTIDLDLSILKVLVSNKRQALDFVNDCDTKLFGSSYWNFANLLVGYIKTYKDIPTLRVIEDRLSKGKNEKIIENVKTIWKQLDSISYDDKEYKYDLEKLKNRYSELEISNAADELSKMREGAIDIKKATSKLQTALQNIKSVTQTKTYESKDIKEYLPLFVDKFNYKKNNPNIDSGIKTGYSFFDFSTNGVKEADFIIIAGESGFGKSLFLSNIGIQTWLQENTVDKIDNFSTGKNIIYFSLEMPFEDCFIRVLSRLSGIPARKIENATINKEEKNKLKKVLDFINAYPYQFKIVDIPDACSNDLEKIMVDMGVNFDILFVDYIGIMRTNEDKEEQDWLKQGIIAYELRAIGRKYKLPIFSAAQLNRKSSTKDASDNIGLNRLARSGTIATHATTVIQIENRMNEENYPDFIYHIIKQRKGIKGKGKLIKNLSCATLLDISPSENGEIDVKFTNYNDDISQEMDNIELSL